MKSSPDDATLGESMPMLVANDPGPIEQVLRFEKRLAGAESNVGIGLSRFGFHVAWASRLDRL